MHIPEVMLTNDPKALADYLEYLAKSIGHAHSEDVATATTPPRATNQGKGLMTKNGAIIAVQKMSIPKRKRTQRVAEEIGQDDEVANEADSEATNEEEVSDEPHLKGLNKEARVTPEVSDGPTDDSSSSSSEITVEDISSDDESYVDDVDVSMHAKDATDTAVTDVEMVTDQQVAKEQILEQHNEAANLNAQFTKQFLNEPEHVDMNLFQLLKNPVYRLERKIDTMSKFNLQAAIDKSLEERLKQIELPKRLPDFGKIKLENSTKKSIPTPLWSKAGSKIYDQKDLLFRMMDKAKTFKCHPKHKALYDALTTSLIVDEDDMVMRLS
nr:hypothetical protein [Tanacetum cinerariifolium]